jgi:hypothetical protein
MKPIKHLFFLRVTGILSALVILLLSSYSCRVFNKPQTKYGAPPIESDYEPVTKYGSPSQFEVPPTQTKYGVPVNVDDL